MFRAIVFTCLAITCVLAAEEGVFAVPVDGYVPRPSFAQGDPTPPSRAPVPGSPDALWLQFDRMDPAERGNTELTLEPSAHALPGASDECREISRLWNEGDFDAAIARLRGYYRFDDPCRVTVATSYRTPVDMPQDGGWGPDVRIGAYDSIQDLMLDRGANGYLYAGMPCQDSTRTRIAFCRSSDNGTSWQATSSVYWNSNDYLSAWSAACHGVYYQVSWVSMDVPHRVWSARKSMDTGGWVRFAGDSLCVIAIAAASGDTIEELTECTTEDGSPGGRIYLFGRDQDQRLFYSWTDSSCRAWRPHSTGVTTCTKGLDCTYNEGYTDRYLWVSWARANAGGDTFKLAFGYRTNEDTLFHSTAFGNVYTRGYAFDPTSITAWKDTITIAFTTPGPLATTRAVHHDSAGNSLVWSSVALGSDTTYVRELPEVSERGGGGISAAFRCYAPGNDRWIYARHAAEPGGTYTDPDTVNESAHRPSPTARIRIVPLGSGSYGVGWINWQNPDPVYHGAWFSSYTPTGIAGPSTPRPVQFGFRATPRPGGARLAFANPSHGPVLIRVFDRAGRLTWSTRAVMAAGSQTVDFNSPAAGAYVAVIEAGGRQQTAKFVTVE